MDLIIQELMVGIYAAYQHAGWWAALATALTFSIRIYRIKQVQEVLPDKAKWAAWPLWARYLFPFLLAFVGALAIALLGNVAVPVAVSGAISAGLASIGLHKGTKAAGQVESAMRGLEQGYEPSPFRDIVSVVVPVDKKLQAPVLRNPKK